MTALCPHTVLLSNLEETRVFAGRLAPLLSPGLRVGLSGPLGAGKTEFVRQLVGELGGVPSAVSSPTYVLEAVYEIEEKRARNVDVTCIRHWDLYRLAPGPGPEELFDLRGFARAITLVEWPERSSDWGPEEDLRLTFAFAEAHASEEGEHGGRRIVQALARSEDLNQRLTPIFEKA